MKQLLKQISILFFASVLAASLFSCEKEKVNQNVDEPVKNETIFLINEGNFMWGNAHMGMYRKDLKSTTYDLFKKITTKDLGDVFQSMYLENDKAILVVNNSDKLEIIDVKNLSSIKTVHDVKSPRYLIKAKNNYYVSSIYNKGVSVYDENFNFQKKIAIPNWTEQMCVDGNKLLVCSPDSKNLYIINTETNQLVDSMDIGFGSSEIITDKNSNHWINCAGKISASISPSLLCIENSSLNIIKQITLTKSCGSLCFNSAKDSLLCLQDGVYKFSIQSTSFPTSPIIPESGANFYGLGVDPFNSEIYVSDAVDFVQKSIIKRYSSDGKNLIHTFDGGIITGRFVFY